MKYRREKEEQIKRKKRSGPTSNPSSPFSTTILLLFALNFSPLLRHTSNKPSHHRRQVILRPTTKNQVICMQEARQSKPSPLLPIPIFTTASIYTLKSQGDTILRDGRLETPSVFLPSLFFCSVCPFLKVPSTSMNVIYSIHFKSKAHLMIQ